MTGRDLIIYILENHLEDEEIIADDKIIGFMTIPEAAAKWNVGTTTIGLLVRLKSIPSIRIGDTFYIPANAKYSTDIPATIEQTQNGLYVTQK